MKENGKGRKKRWIILSSVLAFILLLAGAGIGIFEHFYSRTNYVPEGETYIPTTPETTETTTEKEIEEGVDYSIVDTTSVEETTTRKETEVQIRKTGVMNVLLIGIDIGSGIGNSDAMILCSVNYDTGKIWLTSIMRDIEADIPGYKVSKINGATIVGGPTLLVETLENLLGLKIHHFGMVDIQGMRDVINALGGVDLNVTVDEAAYMGFELRQDMLVHLDGRLALKYARNRTTPGEGGSSDFGRTQRQRNVLMAIARKAKKGGLGDLTEAAEAILPHITHDFKRTEIIELFTELPSLVAMEFNQQRLPYEGLYSFSNENILLDVDATMEKFYQTVYEGSKEQ